MLISKKNMTIFLMNYFILPINTKELNYVLQSYEEPIVDKVGINGLEILNILSSLSKHVFSTMPKLKFEKNKLSCALDLSDKDDSNKIKFFFDLCQRGYIRMPEDVLRDRIKEKGYLNTNEDPDKVVSLFFKNFVLTNEMRQKLDVLTGDPCPFIYKSPGGNCYIDLTMVVEFLMWLILEGREWYSTQHGDRFTLMVKRLIEKELKEVNVLGSKIMFSGKDGKIAEADLLVVKGNVLYVIECKAYSKSRKYLIGDYQEVNTRNSKISEAVKQVRRTCEVLKTSNIKSLDVNRFSEIEWIVCTPSQEFIRPIDRYGMLSCDIPKVCSPEELITYFM